MFFLCSCFVPSSLRHSFLPLSLPLSLPPPLRLLRAKGGSHSPNCKGGTPFTKINQSAKGGPHSPKWEGGIPIHQPGKGDPIHHSGKGGGNPIHQNSPKGKGGTPFTKLQRRNPIHKNSPKCKGGTPFTKVQMVNGVPPFLFGEFW